MSANSVFDAVSGQIVRGLSSYLVALADVSNHTFIKSELHLMMIIIIYSNQLHHSNLN